MPNILDLPLEQQKEIAREEGYSDFTMWQNEMRELLDRTKNDIEEVDAYKPTKKEIADDIYKLKTNPYAIEFYRRITGNYALTVEEEPVKNFV